MKKLFVTLMAIAAITACSKSEVEFEQTGEITFSPVAKNMTKTMMTGTTFQTSEEFNLWAYYKPVTAGTAVNTWLADASDAQTYIDDKTFNYRTDLAKWGGKANPYFWPKTGSLVFIGYYPSTLNEGDTEGAETVKHDLATNTMTFTDIPQSRVAATGYTEDIMYFNLTTSYANNYVEAEFKHALSWISVILVKDTDTPDAATITVNSVEFTNVYPSGDATVVGAADIVWEVDEDATAVDILERTAKVISKNNTTVEAYQPLFIPQDMNGNLVINYTISSNDGSAFTETKTIQLNSMKDSDNNALSKWEAAKHYTYTITIGTSEILVDPTVADWTDVSVPVTVQ